MPGVDRAKKAHRLFAAKLTEKDPVWTQPKRRLKQVVSVDQRFAEFALHGDQSEIIRTVQLHFGSVLHNDHPLLGWHLAQQRIEEGRLARRGTAADQDRLPILHRFAKKADR